MILLSKLDGSKVLIEITSIKYIESTPDSLIRFINGDTLLVLESLQGIEERVLEFKKKLLN